DGTLLLSTTDRVFRIRDAATGKLLHELSRPAGTTAIALSPDGTRVAGVLRSPDSAGESHSALIMLTIPSGAIVTKPTAHPFPISSIKFSPDGKLIVTDGGLSRNRSTGAAQVWDAASLRPIAQLTSPSSDSATGATWSNDGHWVAIMFRDGSV